MRQGELTAERSSGGEPDWDEPGFHRTWVPVALSSEIDDGAVQGVDVLGTRVVAYRDAAGAAVVQSAWCPHLGADLSLGQVVEGQIRCPYHHWRFDGAGACVHIPTGDKIPPGARIARYPTAEAWGLVWAFNGETPLYDVPRIPDVEERALVLETHRRGIRQVPPWVTASNGVDFQHLRTLHGLPTSTPDSIEVRAHSIEYCIETPEYLQHGLITGTNVFSQHLRRGGMDLYMLFTSAPIDGRRGRGFFAVGVPRGGDGDAERAAAGAQLAAVRHLVERLLGEDEPVFNTMRFRKGVLVASDRHLSRYFKYVSEFPRGEPPCA